LQRFARPDAQSDWKSVGGPIAVVVGRSGLGWGRGINPPVALPGPIKQEGDGRSPAGVFSLSSAFGSARPEELPGIKLPYLPLNEFIECVDDPKSGRYNSIVDRTRVPEVEWKSSEKMLEVGAPYRLGVVVEHNGNPRLAGGGSCIFMHIWKGPGSATSGCTAMAPENMELVASWLDPSSYPVLVQLPQHQYNLLKNAWGLP